MEAKKVLLAAEVSSKFLLVMFAEDHVIRDGKGK